MRIEGTAAIVTGGGSGLGAATARMLAARGAQVGVLDISAGGAGRMAAEIGGLALACDVTRPEAVEAALAEAAAAHGVARILVNCAGIGTAGRIVGRDGPMPLAAFRRVIEINLVGTFNMLRLAAAAMAGAEPLADGARGVIVNTASVAATDGQIGIRVNTIAPGIFRTPLLGTLPEEAQASLAASIPFPSRLGTPEEFADAVRFAVENDYLNAEVIRLDGAVRLAPR
jgi:NAD(P)-dependent dehydrogenase (short-subunit alcohol dehydrogenase family)